MSLNKKLQNADIERLKNILLCFWYDMQHNNKSKIDNISIAIDKILSWHSKQTRLYKNESKSNN